MIRGLLRNVGLGAVLSLVRMALGLVSVKVTAVYLGPAGMLLVGQLGSFITLGQAVLGNGLNNAVVRTGAALLGDRRRWLDLHATASRVALLLGLLAAAAIVSCSGALSAWLLHDRAHQLAIVVAGLAVAALLPAGVWIAELNASGHTDRTVRINVFAALLGFCLFVPAAYAFGVAGGLVAAAASYAVTMPVALYVWRTTALPARPAPGDGGAFSRADLRTIAGFYPMLVVPAIAQPGSQIAIRDAVSAIHGLDAVGMLQACWRISDTYLPLVTTGMSLYLMPRLGRLLGEGRPIGGALWQAMLFSAGAVALIASTISALREPIIGWVFTREFAPMASLLPWQVAGDVTRVAAWTLGVGLIALKRRIWFMALESLNPLLYWALASQAGTAALVAVPQARLGAYAAQIALALFALRAVLVPRRAEA